jgi:hypothetical protein
MQIKMQAEETLRPAEARLDLWRLAKGSGRKKGGGHKPVSVARQDVRFY